MRRISQSRRLAAAVVPLVALLLGAGFGIRSARAGGTVESALVPLSSDRALLDRYRRPAEIPAPSDNAITQARTDLGRTLFFDPRLSGSKLVSCASCHNPNINWGDGLPKGIGEGGKELGRRTPTVLNLAWASALFWDGRAETLEEQALGPIQAPREMNLTLTEMEQRLNSVSAYKAKFLAAYPGEPVSRATVAKALATFERTIVSGEAPFDRWVAGDELAVSNEVKQGFRLFNGKANCATCHSNWRFTDDSFHDIGVAGADSGHALIVRDVPGLEFSFKTPTLRNVAERHPYMHDGSERTLADVIDLYDRGGRAHRSSLSDEIHPLHLTDIEKRSLGAFLASLTSRDARVVPPTLPR